MSEYLDNPVWHALVGPHAHIANGACLARHYPRDMVPFSGIEMSSAAAYGDFTNGHHRGFKPESACPILDHPEGPVRCSRPHSCSAARSP